MDSHKPSLMPCETPGCSAGCAYAYSCHERRLGRKDAISWPGVGLIVFAALGLIALIF
ncbi:MAG: hypothetical protein ACR2RL_01175 [Gammaproteobacteria bacterium]